jgi:cytochrome c-type biogenesis protein CcmH/NrfF
MKSYAASPCYCLDFDAMNMTSEPGALHVHPTKKLRCLLYKNQNLADFNAYLAKDLCEKAYEMVNLGKALAFLMDQFDPKVR